MTLRPSSLALLLAALALAPVPKASAQDLDFTASRAEVDFSKKLQTWDGFGFNYVESAQTMDYAKDPQEYGGFSLLKEEDRQKIVELVFGDDGLRVGLLKMFLDPWHQVRPGGPYDHETSTKWLRYFAREGVKKTRAAGRDLTIITTLYGPPAYMTKQKVMRGRDLDPAHQRDLALYLVNWVKFLREKEGLPVKYVSLHNEGEDWFRWNRAGLTEWKGQDYNLFWPPEQVVEFIKLVTDELKAAGLDDVGVTPGENTNWYRWGAWGYAEAIADDAEALRKLGLITSHGFYAGNYGHWFGEHKSAGIDLLRAKRPELHAWVTSTSWSQMDAKNIKEHHGNIYTAKVNAHHPVGGHPAAGQMGGWRPQSRLRLHRARRRHLRSAPRLLVLQAGGARRTAWHGGRPNQRDGFGNRAAGVCLQWDEEPRCPRGGEPRQKQEGECAGEGQRREVVHRLPHDGRRQGTVCRLGKIHHAGWRSVL